MKIILPFLILCFVSTTHSNAQFISNNGEDHVFAGAVISATTYTVVYASTKNKKKAFWYSLGVSTLAGIGKEIYDSTKPLNKFDTADLLATSVGGITASTTLSLFVGRNRKKKRNIALVN